MLHNHIFRLNIMLADLKTGIAGVNSDKEERLDTSLLPDLTNTLTGLMIHPTALDASACIAANELNASFSRHTDTFQYFFWLSKVARWLPNDCHEKLKQHIGHRHTTLSSPYGKSRRFLCPQDMPGISYKKIVTKNVLIYISLSCVFTRMPIE